MCTVLRIRDSTQVNLARVNDLINRLEYKKVAGVSNDHKDVTTAMAAERAAIQEVLKCGDKDIRITPGLIDSLQAAAAALGVVDEDSMKSHTSSC